MAKAERPPPVNLSALARISGGDAAAERRLLDDFCRVAEADLQDLGRAAGRRNPRHVVQLARRTSGAARLLGAGALAAACARIEDVAQARDWSSLDVRVDAAEREFLRLRAWLDELTASQRQARPPIIFGQR